MKTSEWHQSIMFAVSHHHMQLEVVSILFDQIPSCIATARHSIAVKIGHFKKCICFSFLAGTVTMCNIEGLPVHYPEGHSNTPRGCNGRMTVWWWEGPVRVILGTLRCKKLLKTFYFPLLLSQWSHRL